MPVLCAEHGVELLLVEDLLEAQLEHRPVEFCPECESAIAYDRAGHNRTSEYDL